MFQLVLNVDDFEPQRYRRSAILRQAGFEVAEAETGRQALGMVRQQHPALVVLDVCLPDLDGMEVCRAIKADAATARTLVLHISAAFLDAASRVHALENGADGFLTEPVEPEELVAQIRSLLRLAAAESKALKAEQRAEEHRARLEAVYEAMHDGLTLFNMAGQMELANRALARFCDFDTVEDMMRAGAASDQPFELAHLDGTVLPVEAWPVWRVLRGESLTDCELRVRRVDSGRSWVVSYSGEPIRDAQGRQTHAMILTRDITDQKRAEEALRDALAEAHAREAEIESIYDSAPIGLCIVDREGRYRRINRRLAEINGPSRQGHIGRTVREVVPGIADQAEAVLRQVLETGLPLLGAEISGELPSQPGVIRTWIENWCPVRDEQGALVGVNVTAEEITRRKQIEEELRQANGIKDDFLATLSHELRTPLNSILGWSHLLLRGGLNEAASQQALETIARNAEAQRQLITDVLDVSRMLSGKLRLEVRELDVMSVVRLAIESIQPALEAKRLQLTVSSEVDRATVTADPNRLQQIVWNLLSNAVKFTPPGGRITVMVRGGYESLDLIVSDEGAGIRPDFLPHVFDRFAQADLTASRRHGGLGLGLSIVRQLVEMHGGRVFAASDGVGKGATFTVSLPFRVVDHASAEGAPSASAPVPGAPRALDGLRVLVVDDLEDARSLAATLVHGAGGRAVLASSADEGLSCVAETRPDLILADLGMPEVDGYEFLRRLRELPKEAGGGVPVIALTAYGGAADRAKALAAGFAEHLAKPVPPDDLLAALARFVPKGVP